MPRPDPPPVPSASPNAASTELARVQEALRVSEASRRESESLFAKTFDANPAFMTIGHVADGRLLEVNPAFERESGYRREEVLGRSTLELNLWVRPEERDEFLRQMRATGSVRDFEANFRAKSGEIRTLLLNADILAGEGPACMLTVGIDITERRRREQVQNATYRISQAALADNDLAAFFAEIHLIIAGLMPARNLYVALLSLDRSLLSFPYFVDERSTAPAPRKPGNGLTEYVLDTAKPLLTTADELTVLLRERGRYQAMGAPAALWLGAPLLVEGRAIGVIAVQDYSNPKAYGEEEQRLLTFVAEQAATVVHRRQIHAAIRQAEEQYRGIFENALEGLYQSSPSGRFLRANSALARMCGYESSEQLLHAINDIGHQIYVDEHRREQFLELAKVHDQVTDFESEIFRRDGSRIWISESVRVVRNSAGELARFEGVAIDITQQREAARALQAAKEAADAASGAKSQFLASVSHELRTPLNGILGYTQILRRDPLLGEKQREGIRVIHESAEHLLVLINDVLDLSKIEAGRIELHPGDFALAEFAAGAERVFAPRAREKNLLLETALAPDLPEFVRGDEARLRQVVFNLLGNAVKFTAQGGVVFSISSSAGGGLRFSVSDTGRGIAAADLSRIFEPFTQVGESTGAATGTGLGLAISRSLVERMGGRLQVESKPGWGSRFWFDLPLPAAASAAPRTAAVQRVTGYDGPIRRVLVVDDNTANRSVMAAMLAPLGFDLLEADDGRAALDAAARAKPDLVLMDLRLPGEIDGLEATRQLRQTAHGSAARIVAVSASAYDIDQQDCRAAGCDAFLAKPFREEDLWRVIGETLSLVWRFADDGGETRTPFVRLPKVPPIAVLDALHELARKGDIVGLRRQLEQLAADDAALAPFVNGLLELAARFKMKAIRQFLERYRAGSTPPIG
ncbi:PAS domain S-box protein [Opitutus terrae]|nr:PAS domain S-box protein [Opitutus terrae]